MSGWKTWLSVIGGICGGIILIIKGLLAVPMDFMSIGEGVLVILAAFGIGGIGHKIDRMGKKLFKDGLKSFLVFACLLFLASSAYGQDARPFKGLFIAPEATAKAKAAAFAAQPLMTVFDNLPFNLAGDTLYRINVHSIDVGIGIDLASYKGILTLRAEASQSTEGEGQFAGAGLFVNIPMLLNMIPGVSWNASYINPSIGVVPGYDFRNNKYDTALVLSIIQVNF